MAIALIHEPELLFLDEPTSGVDPEARRAFWDIIYALADGGTTVFVTTHYMDEAEHCGRLGIMDRGRLLAMDSPTRLRASVEGDPWNLAVDGVSPVVLIDRLAGVTGVTHAGLLGDAVHVITAPGAHTATTLGSALGSALGETDACAGRTGRSHARGRVHGADRQASTCSRGGGRMRTRLLSIIRKEFIHILRDPRTLVISFVMPLVMLVLLGVAATTDVRNVPLAVWDQDRTPESRALVDAYRAADYFQVAWDVGSEEDIRSLITSGQARAGMTIPPGYGEALSAGRGVAIRFVIDGSDPTVAQTALAAATQLGQAKSVELMTERLAARGQSGGLAMPLTVQAQVWYNPDLKSAYYMVPALIGIIMLFLCVVLTSTAIVRERERGTIEQLIVTPIRSWELLVGKLAPYVLLAFVDTIMILVLGVLLFGVPIAGSVPLLLACSALFLVIPLGVGLLISTFAKTQQEAVLVSLFFLLPNIFLSGFFFPIAAMPQWLQLVTYLFPLRYFLSIVRGIILKGADLAVLYPEVIAITIYGTIVMTIATRRFRKRLD